MCARKLFPHIQAGDIAIVVARGAWCNLENSYLRIEIDIKIRNYRQFTIRSFNNDISATQNFFNYPVTSERRKRSKCAFWRPSKITGFDRFSQLKKATRVSP